MPVIPYDPDAEMAVLGAMLLSMSAVQVAKAMLLDVDFYQPHHRAVFGALCTMYEDGVAVDPVTTAAALDTMPYDRPNGGWKPLLLNLHASAPASVNVIEYAEVVIERADRRRLLELASRVQSTAFDLGVEVDEVVNAAKIGLDAVQRAGGVRVHPSYAEWKLGVNMAEDWLVPDMLERKDRVLLVAPEGFGKSHLLRQWALMCACGVHWFTERPMRRSTAMVIDVENSDRQIVRNTERMYSFAKERVPGFDDERFVVIPFDGLDITQRSDRLRVESYLAGHRPDLLVIGPLYKILPPPSMKFSYEETAMRGISVIDDWRARYGVAVLIEHHAPKGSGGQRQLDPLGSSAWIRWPEFGLAIGKDEDNPRLAKVGHFRGQREYRPWPAKLERGGIGQWDWRAPAEHRVEDKF